MNHKMTLWCAMLAAVIVPAVATAQSLSPMRGEISSFTDRFAVRVFPANPYQQRLKVRVIVYDQDFYPIPGATVTPQEFTLSANGSRPVLAIIPFEGGKQRKVRVCAESIPFPNQQTQIRTQICGKFLGQKRL
jgi:hypothetical protein